jgi:arginyl-tRNA synthetase
VRAKRIIELTKKVKSARLIFTSPDEFNLIKEIARFPNIVRDCVRSYQVHSLAKYAYELAFTFNTFYEKCRVSDEPNNDIKMSRLKLVNAYTKIIKKVLYLLGIDTPEFM